MGEGDLMYAKLASSISKTLLKKAIITTEEFEVVEYGLNYLLQTSSYLLIFIAAGWVLEVFWGSIGFILSFFIIRSCCGGIHCKSEWQCFTISLLMYGLNIFILKHYYGIYIYHLFFWSSISSILILGPIDHENKPFLDGQKLYFIKKSKLAAAMLVIVYGIFVYFQIQLTQGVLLGGFSAAASLLIAHIKRREILT